ncbi:MAG: GAF domain-containing protein [Myxococcota bacterium]
MNITDLAKNFLKNKYSKLSSQGEGGQSERANMFLEDIIEIARALFEVEAASLFAINHTAEEIYALKSAGAGTEDLNKITIKFGIGIVGHTAKEKSCIISNNPEQDIRFNRGFDRKTGFKTKNILSYPIIYDTKIFAILELINKKENFTESDKGILNEIFLEIKDIFISAINNNSYLRQ